jgi:NDP-sugar pyrophosphorylase family protein
VLSDLYRAHTARGASSTVVTVPLRSPYGIADVRPDGFIREFREKPELPYWINAGIYLLNWEVLLRFPDEGDHEDTLFPQLATEGTLSAYQFNGFWRAIDTAKDLADLQKELEKHSSLNVTQELWSLSTSTLIQGRKKLRFKYSKRFTTSIACAGCAKPAKLDCKVV